MNEIERTSAGCPFCFFKEKYRCSAPGRKKAAKETQEGCLSLWIGSVCAGGGNVGPGRAAGPDGADIRRMSFLFFQREAETSAPGRYGSVLRQHPAGMLFFFSSGPVHLGGTWYNTDCKKDGKSRSRGKFRGSVGFERSFI